ncbi:MAG: TonB-dependent receptor plug domain-containing protein, partial [Myxococcota bacterium]
MRQSTFNKAVNANHGHRKIDGLVIGLVLCLVATLAADHAYAASIDPFAGVEEMVVTGNIGASLLQDDAVSVVSFDSDYIDALGATNLKDVAQFTPNLEIRSPFAASNPTLFIRGVGLRDFNANSASSVAVFNDDVYMNSPAGQLAQLFDVQNIEIHRGPQGTLNARNASAGAIKVIARKPSGNFESSLKTTYGRFNEVSLEGVIEMPILDNLSVRIASVYKIRDGFTLNRCADRGSWATAVLPGRGNDASFNDLDHTSFRQCFNRDSVRPISLGGQAWFSGTLDTTGETQLSRRGLRNAASAEVPPGIKKWVNNRDNWAARMIFHYEPIDDVDIYFNVHGGQNRGLSRQFETIGRRLRSDGTAFSGPTADISGYVDGDRVIGTNPRGGVPILDPDPTRGDPYAGDYNHTGLEKLDLVGANLVADFEFDSLLLHTVSAWEFNSRFVDADLDGTPFTAIQ